MVSFTINISPMIAYIYIYQQHGSVMGILQTSKFPTAALRQVPLSSTEFHCTSHDAGKNIRLFFLGQENINMIIQKQEFQWHTMTTLHMRKYGQDKLWLWINYDISWQQWWYYITVDIMSELCVFFYIIVFKVISDVYIYIYTYHYLYIYI